MMTKLSSSNNLSFIIEQHIINENIFKNNLTGFVSSKEIERLDFPLEDKDSDENSKVYYHDKAYWTIALQQGLKGYFSVFYAVPFKNIFEGKEIYYGWMKHDGEFVTNGYKSSHPGDRDKIFLFLKK